MNERRAMAGVATLLVAMGTVFAALTAPAEAQDLSPLTAGDRIFFSRYVSANESYVASQRVDATDLRNFARQNVQIQFDPVVNRAGTRLAGRQVSYQDGSSVLLTTALDGSDVQQLALSQSDSAPIWSRDDSALISRGTVGDGSYGIWSVPVNGTAPTLLYAVERYSGFRPTDVSPDGNTLVGTLQTLPCNDRVSKLDIPTGVVTQLTQGCRDVDAHASISPDGGRVAYYVEGTYRSISVINLDGSGERVAWDNAGAPFNEPCCAQPEWSPDGRSLLFLRSDTDGGSLWVTSIDGGSVQKLFSGAYNTNYPRWVSASSADTTAPVISASLTPTSPNGSNGWYSTRPSVHFTCSDSGSGVAVCSNEVLLSEGPSQSTTGTVTDNAGNTASVTSTPVKVDATAPASGMATPAFLSNRVSGIATDGAGSGAQTVTLTFRSAAGTVVGSPKNVACPATGSCSWSSTIPPGTRSISARAMDLAGNLSSVTTVTGTYSFGP